MRLLFLAALCVLTTECAKDPPPVRVASRVRTPVGLLGEWITTAPRALRGDTLVLRADSSARGIIPWERGYARVNAWQIRFGSREPAVTRSDHAQGHLDGGDYECESGKVTEGCTGLPLFCFRSGQQMWCQAFAYRPPDTLALSSGLRYLRIRLPTRASARATITATEVAARTERMQP